MIVTEEMKDYKFWMTPPEIPPKLVSESLVKEFRKLPIDVQHGIIDILRHRKVKGLFDDSGERIPAGLRYQEFLKARPPSVIKDMKDIR